VKSNIGHCLTAAGVAGVIKVLLALQHRQLPPTINFERLNEHIDLQGSPFYVNQRLQEWVVEREAKRRAAVSSFGFSGTNAHLVVGEYVGGREGEGRVGKTVSQNGKVMVPLSARREEQLLQKARDLLAHIRKDGQKIDLRAMAYTLQVGRQAMEERLGLLVSSMEELAEKLEGYVAGSSGMQDVYQGQGRRSKESLSPLHQDEELRETIVSKWIGEKKLGKLLELWVEGVELDWSKLYAERKPQRVSLPGYPFAKQRYWIEAAPAGQPTVNGKGTAMTLLHPLLQQNTSDLTEQRYSTTLTGEEFFLADHQLAANGQARHKVLPGVACLEMACAAIHHAWPAQLKARILELHDTVWLNPIVVKEKKQIYVSLFVKDNDQAGYEIYSTEAGQEVIHCEGEAAFGCPSSGMMLDVEQLKAKMKRERLEASGVYAIFSKMGLHYGPAHQGITDIYVGERQLLARLRLPAVVAPSRLEYGLHPSLMDSALQASIGLVIHADHIPDKPPVPFALDSLRVLSACTNEMAAWVRYSTDSQSEDRITKFDIDLFDLRGNLCVEMRGLSLRIMGNEIKAMQQTTTNGSAHTNGLANNGSTFVENGFQFDDVFYEKLIADVMNRKLSVDEAVELE
jgi:acyl transferase domain-containing protein